MRTLANSIISRAAFALFVCSFIVPTCATTQPKSISSDREVKLSAITRAGNHISVDGKIDERAWAEASTIGEIIQREPNPGQPATERTEVKILFDRDNLYIGVVCFDSEPQRIIGTQMARDADLGADDRIEILIDTFRDRRNAFYFSTNPLGALVDGLIIENGNLNREWDAIWDVRTHRFESGWTAEFAIPFKSLGFNKGQTTWGFNFSRTIKRKIEEDRWASPRLDVKFFQVSEAGEITGLADVEQGRGLDFRPYVSGKALHSHANGSDFDPKAGLDIFYNITPSLKWTTTINTDFAETEVDARQINLTRFPLFFPEKRAFFLENAGVFTFSNTGSEILPFFSRRIGLLEGREVPILAGTKLTGKADNYDIGLIAVRTRETDFTEAKNLFVGRVKRNIFKQSYIGGIFTDGNPAGNDSRRTFGGDLRLFTSKFLGREQNFGVDAFALKTANERVDGKNNSYGFSVRYPNDLFDIGIDWRHIERNFNSALGFVPRRDVNKLALSAEFDPRPKNFLNVRQMFHEFRFTRFTRLDKGLTESWRLFTAPVNYELNSGEHIEFNYAPQFERLFEPFEISEGVILKPGDYRFTRWRAEINTASKRPWKVDATVWFGTYWSGHAEEVNTAFQYKLAPHLQMSIGANQTFARLPEGNFVARVLTFRANYSVSPYLTFFNFVQYDNESRNLGWQSRVRWIIRPGSEVFLVFNQGWLQDERGGFHFRSADTRFAGKMQYTFRF
ncbi:MAG TPA: DUF5916 domain-containing protein [Blastocatellia bacterium]|nr:DUF5916 domain-containing protein [Blastocatellia bacterium]